DQVGLRLCERTAALVAPPPPAGTPVDDFLAAVIAGRRERDAARFAREAALRERLRQAVRQR
ncbi:MAG: hypothetical protein QM572_19200, partial [Nocardioides sp.]